MGQDCRKDWREICKAAATELDPAKLMRLIAELTRALEERDQNRKTTLENTEGRNDNVRSLRSEPAV